MRRKEFFHFEGAKSELAELVRVNWTQLKHWREYLNEWRELKTQYGKNKQRILKELISYFAIRSINQIYHERGFPQDSSFIIDGGARSGTTTLGKQWEKYLGFKSLPVGIMFRTIASVCSANNLSPQEVIALAQKNQLHFKILYSEGTRIFEIGSIDPACQFLVSVSDTKVEQLRSQKISSFAAELNSDGTKAIEKLVIDASGAFLRDHSGFYMEGRNTASLIPDRSIHAFHLSAPDHVAAARARQAAIADAQNEGKAVPSVQELDVVAQDVIIRNAKDVANGVLLSKKAALASGIYHAIYQTELGGIHEIFLSMMTLHRILEVDDLFMPSATNHFLLRSLAGYREDPAHSLVLFSRRNEPRREGIRALA